MTMILFTKQQKYSLCFFVCLCSIQHNFFAKIDHSRVTGVILDPLAIVLESKLLKFNETIDNAYNASIIEEGNRYLLVFRHDVSKLFSKEPTLKMVYLDKDFTQISPIKTIDSTANLPEDARIHRLNGGLFLTYNDDYFNNKSRRLFCGKFDINACCLSHTIQLAPKDLVLTPVEKNWVPFEYPENSGSLHYIYSTSPTYKIIKVDEATTICSIPTKKIDAIWSKDTWGEIRGGTPARLIDGVYLTFFHSWKYNKQQKSYYYVMGAYIFQNCPPFKILAITPKPIFFKNVYSAPHRRDDLHVVFPAGFVIEKKNNKVILHVSCGENDTSVRIVSIDKDALLKSMVPVEL